MKNTKQEWKQFVNVMWVIAKHDVLPFIVAAVGVMAGILFVKKHGEELKKDFKTENVNVFSNQNQKQRN